MKETLNTGLRDELQKHEKSTFMDQSEQMTINGLSSSLLSIGFALQFAVCLALENFQQFRADAYIVYHLLKLTDSTHYDPNTKDEISSEYYCNSPMPYKEYPHQITSKWKIKVKIKRRIGWLLQKLKNGIECLQVNTVNTIPSHLEIPPHFEVSGYQWSLSDVWWCQGRGPGCYTGSGIVSIRLLLVRDLFSETARQMEVAMLGKQRL